MTAEGSTPTARHIAARETICMNNAGCTMLVFSACVGSMSPSRYGSGEKSKSRRKTSSHA
jgi:hypothetical protein